MSDRIANKLAGGLRAFGQNPRRVQVEIDEEIADHLDRLENRYAACGYSEEDARRAARERFGDPDVYARKTVSAAVAPRRVALITLIGGGALGLLLIAAVFVTEMLPTCSF